MKKKIAFGSDIHLEFGPLKHVNNHHNADILVLAGDISTPHKWRMNHNNSVRNSKEEQLSFFKARSEEFPEILYIPGNYEHYHGDYDLTEKILQDNLAQFGNIKVGNHLVHEGDGFTILANTLWTDFDKGNPTTFIYANIGMNDFRLVSRNGDAFRAEQAAEIHKLALEQMASDAEKAKQKGNKIIIVSHHLPSFKVIAEGFRDSRLNGAYASGLEWFMEKYEPVYWIHGHSHPPCDTMIGKTRVIRNPRGYVGYEHTTKDDLLYDFKVVEI
jgi:Icc-related predicted phosphoesterase